MPAIQQAKLAKAAISNKMFILCGVLDPLSFKPKPYLLSFVSLKFSSICILLLYIPFAIEFGKNSIVLDKVLVGTLRFAHPTSTPPDEGSFDVGWAKRSVPTSLLFPKFKC